MAYALDDSENDQPQSQVAANGLGEGEAQPKNQAPSLGATGGAVLSPGGGAVGAQSAQTGNKPATSNWANLQDYVSANQGQGEKMGSDVGADINTAGTKAETDLNKVTGDFKAGVDAGTVAYNPDAVNADVQGAVNGQDTSADFSKYSGASYGGPSDFTQSAGYGNVANEVAGVQNDINATKSEAGRDALLQQHYQNQSQNPYTLGQTNFDQALVEASPGINSLSGDVGAYGRWQGLTGALSQHTGELNARAQAAKATDAATAAQAQAALIDPTAALQTQVTGQAQAAQTARTAEYNKLQADLKSGTLTPAEAGELGLTPGARTYGVDLSSFLTPGQQATTANTATPDQYAAAAALAKLAGQPQSSILAPSNASDAGTSGPAYNYDTQALMSAINNAKGGYDPTKTPGYATDQLSTPKGSMTPAQIQNILTQVQSSYGTDPSKWGTFTGSQSGTIQGNQFTGDALRGMQKAYDQWVNSPSAYPGGSTVNTTPRTIGPKTIGITGR